METFLSSKARMKICMPDKILNLNPVAMSKMCRNSYSLSDKLVSRASMAFSILVLLKSSLSCQTFQFLQSKSSSVNNQSVNIYCFFEK